MLQHPWRVCGRVRRVLYEEIHQVGCQEADGDGQLVE